MTGKPAGLGLLGATNGDIVGAGIQPTELASLKPPAPPPPPAQPTPPLPPPAITT